MATAKLLAEQVKNLEDELQQKENRLKELRQKQKMQESKERTHRLIERGAILENLIDGAITLTNEQIKMFLIKTVQTDFARRILTQIREQIPPESNAEQQAQPSESDGDMGEKSEIERTDEG